MGKRARARGKPDVFTVSQNRALRATLKAMHAAGASQSEIATSLDVVQQTASKLLNDPRAGFSYASATRVAQLAGFDGVDTFFAANGVAIAPPDSTTAISGDGPDDEPDDSALHARHGAA